MGGPYNIPRNYKGENKILFVFSTKSFILTAVGGFIGIIFGLGLGTLFGKMGYTFTPGIGIVFIAFISSALIGTIFGMFPASKASKLNPIEALRTE